MTVKALIHTGTLRRTALALLATSAFMLPLAAQAQLQKITYLLPAPEEAAASDAAKLARVCRDSRAAVQAAWRERCLAVDADELERMYLMATRAGKTVHASMLLAAARERGLLLSSVVLGRVLVLIARHGHRDGSRG